MGDPKRDPNAKEWPGAVTRTAAMVVTGSRDYIEPRNSAWADFLALATPVRVFLDVENSTHMFADSPVTSHPAGKWMALFLRATLLDDGAAEALVFGDADPKALANEAWFTDATRNAGDDAVSFVACRSAGAATPARFSKYCE